jgi:hypothetical protein
MDRIALAFEQTIDNVALSGGAFARAAAAFTVHV